MIRISPLVFEYLSLLVACVRYKRSFPWKMIMDFHFRRAPERWVRFAPMLFVVLGWLLGGAKSDALASGYSQEFGPVQSEIGESLGAVWSIYRDDSGYMFLGSEDGLSVFDGYSFVSYRNDPTNPDSISSNWITCMVRGPSGKIWIGTKDGLNRFDLETGKFKRFFPDAAMPGAISSSNIRAMDVDAAGTLWVGARDGINRFDPTTETFKFYSHLDSSASNKGTSVTALCVDAGGDVWIGTGEYGLFRFNPQSERFRNYRYHGSVSGSLSSDRVGAICRDKQGRLWIGCGIQYWTAEITGSSGLNLYSPATDAFSLVPIGEEESAFEITSLYASSDSLWVGTLSGDVYDLRFAGMETVRFSDQNPGNTVVTSLYEDPHRVIWIGRQYGLLQNGIVWSSQLSGLTKASEEHGGLSDSHVTAIYEHTDGVLWLGTIAGGLNSYDLKTQTFHDHSAGPNAVPGMRINAIVNEGDEFLWVGGYVSGLTRKDLRTGEVKVFGMESGLNDDRIRSLLFDSRGVLWIGTWKGLNTYDRERGIRSIDYLAGRNDIYDEEIDYADTIYGLMETRDGTIWMGTNHGLYHLDIDGVVLQSWRSEDAESGSLSYNSVRCVFEDRTGNIWVGTRRGLNRLNQKTGLFRSFYEEDGLASNIVFGILEDNNGFLWISTDKGLSRLNLHDLSFRTFDQKYGFLNDGFDIESYFQSPSGTMYFGGSRGLDIFHPEGFNVTPDPPKPVLTSIHVFDKEIRDWQDLIHSDRLEVSYSENFISFAFSALDFVNPKKNQFAYRLVGVDKDWVSSESRHYASYTGLNPGTYEFLLKASNSTGDWSDPVSVMEIVVVPLYYQRVWFRGLLVLLFVLLIVGLHYWKTVAMRKTNAELSLARDLAESASRSKSSFLANMSHEIRTPMNGIIGMVNLMRSGELKQDQRESIEIIDSSAHSLLNLLNDILDLSKVEAGKISIESESFAFRQHIRNIIGFFQFIADEQGVVLSHEMEGEIPGFVRGDADRLRQVLNNLIGNAIKFSPKGKVTLRVVSQLLPSDQWRIRFEVQDNGIGISPEMLEQVFSPFVQVEHTSTRRFRGTGLGLSISRELIKLMGGELKAESALGDGSRFWFEIDFPKGEAIESIDEDISDVLKTAEINLGRRARILVVEDNLVNQKVATKIIERLGHEVVCANDGVHGVRRFQDGSFDLIFMDCQMPNLDGFDATRKIREQENGKGHPIPIIALTAGVMKEERDRCVEAGMNDYMAKPISLSKVSAMIEKWCRFEGLARDGVPD